MLQSELSLPGNPEALKKFEEAINCFSVRIMVEGIGTDVLTDLKSFSEKAQKGGYCEIADRTLILVETLQHSDSSHAEKLLKTGITELLTMTKNQQHGLPATLAAPYASLGDDAELIADFLVEAREHLSLVEGQLLLLEKDPSAIETIHAVFRAFHTIKGLAGFLGFSIMQAVAHEVETLLDLARNHKLIIDTSIVDVVLASSDFLLTEMNSIDRVLGGSPSLDPADNSILIERIRSLAATTIAQAEAVEASSTETIIKISPEALPKNKQKKAVEKAKAPKMNQSLPAATSPEPKVNLGHETRHSETAINEVDFFPTASYQNVQTFESVQVEMVSPAAPVLLQVSTASDTVQVQKRSGPTRTLEQLKAPDSSSVRVETSKLDYLMDMVGEMVIAQSLIRHSQILQSSTDTRLVGDLSHLARVTAEVQRATMSMRMVPVVHLFQKIERVIRDLSRKAGKQVTLQTSGMDTELDKTVAEELSDPLLHMVRNSVDHGIELPEERIKSGKNPNAVIKLAAYHQGGQVIIEISDDGRGLSAKKIRAKAEEKGITHSSAELTEAEVFQLIFAPGFSTAEKITDVSGRGVGMDVVRRNVEKLRGRIETHSELGHGTKFILKLPLTLAIIDGLVVEVGLKHYVVPLSVVREIFRPGASTLFSVEGREEMVLVREQLLPIVRLNQRLGVPSHTHLPSDGLLVVVESENKLYCMLVDDLLGKQEIVIKSLGETFQDASGFSGCAVLADGCVGLILDIDGIYRGRRR